MVIELIATIINTGINLYRVYCEGCEEDIEVKGVIEDNKFHATCPDCGHKIIAKINDNKVE